MSSPRLPLRLILLILAALAAVVVVTLLMATLNSALELYERIAALPAWLRLPLFAVIAALLAGLAWLGWRLWHPRTGARTAAAVALPTREAVETRVAELREREVDTRSLEDELLELDRRRLSGDCHVALFGAISTGKSSLIRALAPDAVTEVDVIGGTTRQVSQHQGQLPDGRRLILADVPGSGEVEGQVREQLARDEALRAHAVVYLTDADLSRSADAELRWLLDFGKPVVLALNKIDQYTASEREALFARFRARYGERVRAIVGVRAGGRERFERRLDDGRVERVEREQMADIAALLDALISVTRGGADALEPAREAAVLAQVDARGRALAREAAARESEVTIRRYTRRAVVGALAAVAPGTDILVQGALGTAMVRELARVHAVPVRELDVEALLARLGLTVRNTSAIALAIIGNGLKAFPGLGTLGGGVVHAVAYGLAFDSLGRAIATSLAEHARLDHEAADAALRQLFAEPSRERIERVARLVLDSLRGGDDETTPRRD